MLLIGFGMSFFLWGHDLASTHGKRVTACAILFQLWAGIGLPVLGYVIAPDWMWDYWIRHTDVPAWVPWYLFILYWIPFFFAFLLGARLTKKGNGWVIGAFVISAIAQVTAIALTFDMYTHVGTTEQYRAGTAPPMPQSSLALPMNIGVAIAVVLGVAIILYLRKSYKQVGPPVRAA